MKSFVFCRACGWERNLTDGPIKNLPLKCPKCLKQKRLAFINFKPKDWKKHGKIVRSVGVLGYLKTVSPDEDAWFASANQLKTRSPKKKPKSVV